MDEKKNPPAPRSEHNRRTTGPSLSRLEEVILLVDTREKRPFLFPAAIKVSGKLVKVSIQKQALEQGDYQILGFPGVVERKAGLRELQQNLCTKDKRRFLAAIKRLRERPCCLVVESDPTGLLTPTSYCDQPGLVVSRLCGTLAEQGIALMLVGECKFPKRRRMVGEFILHWLLAARYT